jgi:dephospho-CoA kinase
MVVFLVGDLLVEWLLSSLSCLPISEKGKGDYCYSFSWLLQSYGVFCPSEFASNETLLSPDATAILFSLRLVFLCLGVHLGESLCFVALTGGIACGKSNVSRILAESESSDNYKDGTVGLICADSIAHQILLPPSVLQSHSVEGINPTSKVDCAVKPKESVFYELVAAFEGHDILSSNGTIDRTKMGSIVFRDREKRRRLNRITHPKIFSILMSRLVHQALFSSNDLVVADVPLLFESGKLSWLFSITICVVTDPVTQFHRLQIRNPELSAKECEDRISSQLNLELKMKMSDIVIDNSGSLHELKDKVEAARRDIMRRLYGIGMSLLQVLLLIGGSTSIAVSSKFFSQT